MRLTIFRNDNGRLRSGWWIAIYLAILALCLFPVILISAFYQREVGIWEQIAIIAFATVICQLLRRRPVQEVTGTIDGAWFWQLAAGIGIGGLLMALPAAILLMAGLVTFDVANIQPAFIVMAIVTMLGVAVAEELLFRGFMFQRMVAGLGKWPALAVLAGMFLLTHFDNTGMTGPAAMLAAANIFIAGIMFGIAFLATQRLALPIGIHFGANVLQGNILGFAVSGTDNESILVAHLHGAPDWLTGDPVGIEGSLPGLIAIVALTGGLEWYRRFKNAM